MLCLKRDVLGSFDSRLLCRLRSPGCCLACCLGLSRLSRGHHCLSLTFTLSCHLEFGLLLLQPQSKAYDTRLLQRRGGAKDQNALEADMPRNGGRNQSELLNSDFNEAAPLKNGSDQHSDNVKLLATGANTTAPKR